MRRLPANTWTIVNPVERWGQGDRGWKRCACMWVRWCFWWNIFIHLPWYLGSNTLDPLVTNPSRWLNDGPGAYLNLLLINLSPCITLNIRSSWRRTPSICLCITGGRHLLEKPTRYISVIKWCMYCLKEASERKGVWGSGTKGRAGKHERIMLQIRWGRNRMRRGVCEGVFICIWFVLTCETQRLLL